MLGSLAETRHLHAGKLPEPLTNQANRPSSPHMPKSRELLNLAKNQNRAGRLTSFLRSQTSPRESAIWLDTIESATIADRRTVFGDNSASAPENVNLGHCIPNWRVALVRWSHSPRLPSASEALAAFGTARRHLRCITELKNWLMSAIRDATRTT